LTLLPPWKLQFAGQNIGAGQWLPFCAPPFFQRSQQSRRGMRKSGGSALAPQTMQAAFRTTGIVGAVEPGEQREATRFVPRHAQ